MGSRIGDIKGVEYIHFIVPGLVMMAVINSSYQNSSSSIMQAKFLRFIEDLLITPLSGLEISLSYIIGGMIRGILNGILVLILGYFLTGFQMDNWLLTFVYLFTVSWAFAGAGVIVGIIAKTWDSIMVITNFFFMPLIFLGGVFWSIEMLPDFWRNFSLGNPLYWMINGLRYAILGISDTSHELSLGISILFALFFSTLASYLFTKGYRIKT
jgi:ABC-2 type transport system permease protein